MAVLVFVDVEGSGHATPATGIMSEFGAVEYKTGREFHGITSEYKAQLRNKPMIGLEQTMKNFEAWLLSFDSRPVMVSDNPAYDFMWIAFYFDKYLGRNPLGHSARRISDFYAGLTKNWRNTQRWKKWRVTPHTHHPVEDCRGNVEAFRTMCERYSIDV